MSVSKTEEEALAQELLFKYMGAEKLFFSATTVPNLMTFVAFKRKSSNLVTVRNANFLIKIVENCIFWENKTITFTTVTEQ